MAVDAMEAKVGEVAGLIWRTLKAKGPMSLMQLTKVPGLSAELAPLGVGWLFREGKLVSETKNAVTTLKVK